MSLDRRGFLLRFGKIALAAAPLTWSCNRAGKDAVPAPELAHPWGEVLTLAARAPSGHNTQPWTVRVVDRDHWIIGIAESRRLPAVDAQARETLLSIGAFLENLIVAARHYGYEADYTVTAHSSLDADIIDLRWRKTSPSPQSLDYIRYRRTVRNGYLAKELRSANISSIMGYGEDLHYFPSGSTGAKYLSEGTVKANRQQAFRDPAELELADWIRWSGADAAKYRNGLTPASMEIEGLAGYYVSHFYNRASVLSKSFRETTIRQVTERVGQGAGWLVIANASGSIPNLLDTGRRFERMWLRLREQKIAVHPMTQMLEETPWRDQIATNLAIAGVPQFILRIGYLNSYPDPKSLRMPPSWIVS